MSQKVQILRKLVEHRLTAAAEEIFGLFERTIAEYEEELCRIKEENQGQRQIQDCVWNPKVLIHKTDVQQLSVVKEEVPPEKQEWTSIVVQEEPEPEPPHIKEEQEELWTSQDVSITKFPSTPFLLKTEDGDELNQTQTEEIKVEANTVDCGGSEPSSSFHPHRHLQRKTDEQNEDCEETEDSDEGQTLNHKPESELPTNSSTDQMETETDGDSGGGSDWKSHLEIHIGEKPFCFSIGGSRFKHMSSLCCHIPSHIREKPFRCSLCDKCFADRSEVRRHIKVHTREKPFGCSECTQKFTCNVDLQRHMRIHTGERPFGCVVCQKRFRRKHHLQTHMKIHTRGLTE